MQVSVSIATSAVKKMEEVFLEKTGRNMSEEDVQRITEDIIQNIANSSGFAAWVRPAIARLNIL